MDDRLHKLAALVEAGSYTKAARTLRISQPGLSAAIKKLEKELGAVLVRTEHRQLVVTPAGQLAYEAALQQRATWQNLTSELARLHGGTVPLRLGLLDSVAALLEHPANPLALLETNYDVSLHVSDTKALSHGVKSGQLDYAIVVGSETPQAGLYSQPLAADRLVLVGSSRQAAQYNQAIAAGRVVPFISYLHTSETARLVRARLDQVGVRTRVVLQSTSPEVMVQMVLRGRGAAVLPWQLVAPYVHSGALAGLPNQAICQVARPLCLVMLRGKQVPRDVEQFLETIPNLMPHSASVE